jgi:hypothetical protein
MGASLSEQDRFRMAVLLILSALGDGVIAAAQMLGKGWLQPWIVSMVSSLSLLLIGGLSLSNSLEANSLEEGEEAPAPADGAPSPEEAGRDIGIMIRLDAVLADHALFLDPGLTLWRLAQRLGRPAKQLSAAINRATGQNVSRYSIGQKNGSIFRIGSDAFAIP